MGRMSNRERIARAAEEAELTAKEKEAAKAAKTTSGGGRRSSKKAPVRMKIVWEVTAGETIVATFAYPDKPAAESKAVELTQSTKRLHTVRPAKVPME